MDSNRPLESIPTARANELLRLVGHSPAPLAEPAPAPAPAPPLDRGMLRVVVLSAKIDKARSKLFCSLKYIGASAPKKTQKVKKAKGKGGGSKSDGGPSKQRTAVAPKSAAPSWDQTFFFKVSCTTSCHAMPRHATPCHAMPRHATSPTTERHYQSLIGRY